MTLEERIDELERVVTDLRDRLAQREVRHSMARTLTCPACGCGTILVVTQVKDATDAGLVNLTLNPSTSIWRGLQPGDPLKVYVCKDCKLVEWHARSIAHLQPNGSDVVELRRPDDGARPSGKPYR